MTDVKMLTDASADQFDVALRVSADSDLVGLIQAMRKLCPLVYSGHGH